MAQSKADEGRRERRLAYQRLHYLKHRKARIAYQEEYNRTHQPAIRKASAKRRKANHLSYLMYQQLYNLYRTGAA